jgi:hypothetical protein
LSGISQQNVNQEQRAQVLNTISDAFAFHVAADTDAELLTTMLSAWTSSCKLLPDLLSLESRALMSKALEAQLTTLALRERERVTASADKDEDDLLELEELEAGDGEVYYAINLALRALLKQQGGESTLPPFLPFLGLVDSAGSGSRNFGLRFIADVVLALKEGAAPLVQAHLPAVLRAISDEDAPTRRAASYVAGVCAEAGPTAFADFAAAAVEPLLASIPPVDEHDQEGLLARDNAVSARESFRISVDPRQVVACFVADASSSRSSVANLALLLECER